eukprot:TRINITY_DN11503_c0_g2_i5.p1 TRINITY_DN11503_c0_g2~~TRINITY_DN11503_c0_g2_i5.p1  ORF type:complete len:111 (-),score=22.71 TRINITY_DN11503_c0_g2_i5:660-992(-)
MGSACRGYYARGNVEGFMFKDEEEVEVIDSPADLETKYQRLVASIAIISPPTKQKMKEIGAFNYETTPDLSYLMLKDKDESIPGTVYYGFWYFPQTLGTPKRSKENTKAC